MKKFIFYTYIIILILKNIQPNDFKNQLTTLTQNQKLNPANRKEFIKTVVSKLNLNFQYMNYFNQIIDRNNFEITKKKDLFKIFHPDKSPNNEEEQNKIIILNDHFSAFFFPDEKTDNKNLEKNEEINLDKLLTLHQNLQIATIFTQIIAKVIVFRLCVSKFKKLQTKMLGILFSSIVFDSIPLLLVSQQEYIYKNLKNASITILFEAASNILLWNYFIKENLNRVYATTLACSCFHILLIPTYKKTLNFYQNSFICGKIVDLFFQEYSNKNIYKEHNNKNQISAIEN